MSRIRRCDRCHEVYNPYENGFNTVGTSTYNMDEEQIDVHQNYDLCPKCKAEFLAWLEAHKY